MASRVAAGAACPSSCGWQTECYEQPALGDVFLLHSKELRRFAHTGIVVELAQSYGSGKTASYVCTTVEGNTNS